MRIPPAFRGTYFLPVLLLAICFAACSDDATEPPVNSFSLQTEVLRPDGTPVEGLTVALWNYSDSLDPYIQDARPKRRIATRVNFSLPRLSICTLTVYDLEDKLLQSVLEADTLLAGVHAVVVGPEIEVNAGVKVMRYELVVHDLEDGSELFRDEKYMTAVLLDPTRMVNGKTDADGRFEISDRTILPGLYDLGELPATNENGEVMGSFTLDALLTVRFYDESGSYLRVQQMMNDGANTIKATWDPPVPKQDIAAPTFGADAPIPMQGLLSRDVSDPPMEFKLYQNFPNPFN